MGQKVHPTGIRLGIVKDHTSVWYADKASYAGYLINDLEVRAYLRKRLSDASVSRIDIERPAQTARITIHTARPGIVIGKKGEDVERLRAELSKKMGVPVHVNIEEIRKPELDADLVAQNVAQQLERRVQFRRAMRRVMQNAMRLGAEGIKVRVAGRLGGAEIARSEVYHEGRVPLHTLRADIDYATAEALTTYGILGIKVWIFNRLRAEQGHAAGVVEGHGLRSQLAHHHVEEGDPGEGEGHGQEARHQSAQDGQEAQHSGEEESHRCGRNRRNRWRGGSSAGGRNRRIAGRACGRRASRFGGSTRRG